MNDKLKKKLGLKLIEMAVDYLSHDGSDHHVWHLRLAPDGRVFWHTLLSERYGGVPEPVYNGRVTNAEFYGGEGVLTLSGACSPDEYSDCNLDGRPALTRTGRASKALRQHLIEYELHNALVDLNRKGDFAPRTLQIR